MEFNERAALKLRLEQLAQQELYVIEQIKSERIDILDRLQQIDNYHSVEQIRITKGKRKIPVAGEKIYFIGL